MSKPRRINERNPITLSEDRDALDGLVRRQTKAGQFKEYSRPKDALRHFRIKSAAP